VPPSLPTTSPVAVATTRILAAYLSNHRLSPAEAASLSGIIADTLASLTNGGSMKRHMAAASVEEPAPRRQAAPRAPRQARAVAATPPPGLAPPISIPEPIPEPITEPEVESGPVTRAVEVANPPHEETYLTAPEPVAEAEAEADAEPEVADAAGSPRKRKRPSRPRSRRGMAAGGTAAAEAMPHDAPQHEAPQHEAPDDDARAGEASEAQSAAVPEERHAGPEPVTGDEAAEPPAAAPKPRRTAGRARRVPSP
jgi:hypothetical protein